MRKTTKEEIEIVSTRLQVFSGEVKPAIVSRLTEEVERSEQHRLFWLLLDDRTFVPFERAISIFKRYGDEGYLKRAYRKSQEANDPVQYSAAISELIAVAYYIEKFDYAREKVIWERKVSDSGKSVDISIKHGDEYVNIEVH